MRVHHLNCATLCPIGRRLLNGTGSPLERARLICHCLLIETDDGLVLIDTGFGLTDLAHPSRRLGPAWIALMSPALNPDETAFRQIEALGFSPSDVRHIVLTHLDFDHAGGLPEFPRALVHVFAKEHQAADHTSAIALRRYSPSQWAHGPRWALHEVADGERWFGFEAVRAVEGVGQDILLIPLLGHSQGHCGVAIKTGDSWLLHCGDAYFHHWEVDPDRPRAPLGIRAYQQVYQSDRGLRLQNQERLRELTRRHGHEVSILCSHDPYYLERAASLAANRRKPLGIELGAAPVAARAS